MHKPKRKQRYGRRVRVMARPGQRQRGVLLTLQGIIPVALGRGGLRADKREGDGGTPRGVFHPLRVWYRPDRGPRPKTRLPIREIGPDDAWCEEPSDRRYNRPMWFDGSGDRLCRDDALYDLFVEIDHNVRPRVAGRGSAVFIHIARPGMTPTAGCVAMERRALERLIARWDSRTRIVIG